MCYDTGNTDHKEVSSMAELEKLYTVEDIARMTALTTRTIRNYLRNGTLKGRKIGGQWRFTPSDIQALLERGEVITEMRAIQRQSVLDFIDGVNTGVHGTMQICTIVDLYIPQEEAARKSDALCALVNASQGESLTYHYDYLEAEGKARYVLFASPDFLMAALKLLKE